MAAAQEARAPDTYEPPLFRTPVVGERPAEPPPNSLVRLLADTDFAPFSFLTSSGAPAGLSVELAITACEQAQLRCVLETRPFGEIMDALKRGEGDVAVTGPRLDDDTLRNAQMTRPYFRIMARFAVPAKSEAKSPDPLGLAGQRVAVVQDTVHQRWLETYYRSADITPFANWAAAAEAVKKGEADAIFGDNLQVIYWLAGDASADCCKLLGGAFSDFDVFSRNLAFLVRRDRPDLRAAFDFGLDKAQETGATSKILHTYIPLDPW